MQAPMAVSATRAMPSTARSTAMNAAPNGGTVVIRLAEDAAAGLYFAGGRRYYADHRRPEIVLPAEDAATLVGKGAFGYVNPNSELGMLNAEEAEQGVTLPTTGLSPTPSPSQREGGAGEGSVAKQSRSKNKASKEEKEGDGDGE